MKGELMLKIIARFPTTGAPTKIMSRRDFGSMAAMKITMDNLIARSKNVKIVYAGKINQRECDLIDARERFKRAGEIMLYRSVQLFK